MLFSQHPNMPKWAHSTRRLECQFSIQTRTSIVSGVFLAFGLIKDSDKLVMVMVIHTHNPTICKTEADWQRRKENWGRKDNWWVWGLDTTGSHPHFSIRHTQSFFSLPQFLLTLIQMDLPLGSSSQGISPKSPCVLCALTHIFLWDEEARNVC